MPTVMLGGSMSLIAEYLCGLALLLFPLNCRLDLKLFSHVNAFPKIFECYTYVQIYDFSDHLNHYQ